MGEKTGNNLDVVVDHIGVCGGHLLQGILVPRKIGDEYLHLTVGNQGT